MALKCIFCILYNLDGSSLNHYSSGLYTTSEDDLDFGIRFLLIVGW